MRRLTWKAGAAYLGAGLVISVGIAWAGVMLEPRPGTYRWSPMVSREMPERGAPPRPIERFGIRDGLVSWRLEGNRITARGWVVRREQFVLFPGQPAGGAGGPAVGGIPFQDFEVYGAGWPLAALEWSDREAMRMSNGPPAVSGWEYVWEFGVEYRERPGFMNADVWRRLPVRPWCYGLGLAANSLVWGAVVGAVVMTPGVLRRRRRRGRRLCVECGYPVGDAHGRVMARCPECGVGVLSGEGAS